MDQLFALNGALRVFRSIQNIDPRKVVTSLFTHFKVDVEQNHSVKYIHVTGNYSTWIQTQDSNYLYPHLSDYHLSIYSVIIINKRILLYLSVAILFQMERSSWSKVLH